MSGRKTKRPDTKQYNDNGIKESGRRTEAFFARFQTEIFIRRNIHLIANIDDLGIFFLFLNGNGNTKRKRRKHFSKIQLTKPDGNTNEKSRLRHCRLEIFS